MRTLKRRELLGGVVWSVPVVVVGAPAAQAACSGPVTTHTPDLATARSATTSAPNGHTRSTRTSRKASRRSPPR
ncbi:hypothetical protein JQN72_00595 [Phycicoccus sp. CSK15P-2]|uniref:hypothetical protein n=1 Tax=Phycicoccus sp. CSK15P-2 TaxID=2807627 RepID=UPI00194EF584|nr:hypothetical protein [Phycicoccus sp. CSK15P-2]MBM6402742.1 hypothetical protein [Phycicoccus sp. CSK15P-2]